MGFRESFNRVLPAAIRAFGCDAVLIRAGLQSDAFAVKWSDQKYEVIDVGSQDFATKVESRDFDFAVGVVVLLGDVIEPRKGDVIKITEGNCERSFEIMPPAGSKMAAVEKTPGGYRWLVHTKRVG